MTYKTIPLNAIPNQQFTVTLDGQICQIRLYWRYDHLYCDLNVQDEVICTGVLCVTNEFILQQPKLNFSGNLLFVDKEGHGTQPDYKELGTRFVLCFVPESEM
jgi:hypothetical protein